VLVFFDILLLNGCSLLCTPYTQRRAIFESILCLVPGHAILAHRQVVHNADELRTTFAALVADCEEGAVLKAGDGQYNDWIQPWIKVGRSINQLYCYLDISFGVKLKKDYIPGHGDTFDLMLIGAGWDKERAREPQGRAIQSFDYSSA
jgi:DNA ligase 4